MPLIPLESYCVPERAGDMLFGHRFPPHVPCSTQDALRNVKMLSVHGLFYFVSPYKPSIRLGGI